MDAADLHRVVEAWIINAQSEQGTPEYEETFWAFDAVMDWTFAQPQLLWQFILLTYPRPLSDMAVAQLAAGPMEDLLAKFGREYVDQVEELARKDSKFNYLLGGVWQSSIPLDIWQRIEKTRLKTW